MTQFVAPHPSLTPGKRSTIIDVARIAEVSIKTVSRVVRQEPNVAEETRLKVKAVMEQLNYRPTPSARSSTSARSFMIGLVLDNPQSAYAFQLLRGAHAAARANGYHLIVEPLNEGIENRTRFISDLVIQSNLDGLIVPPPLCDDDELLDELNRIGRPYARISPGKRPDDGFSVSIDDEAAARAVTGHLIDLGHTRIGFVKGTAGAAASDRRFAGYSQAMQAAGLAIDPRWVAEGNFDLKSGVTAGEKLIRTSPELTAVFAANDAMGAGVQIAAYRNGKQVPQDLSIAGFDDSVMATAMEPPLTTIRQRVFDMADIATERLIEHLRHRDRDALKDVEIDYELIVRGSTGPAPLTR